jgi:ATP-dependent 26S proteasome regulatory subunit
LEKIDKALLRPGRVDKDIFLDFPSIETKADLLKKMTRASKIDDSVISDMELSHIANTTPDQSFSHVINLFKERLFSSSFSK